MILNGTGGANTNATGLKFEKKTSLEDLLIENEYAVDGRGRVYDADGECRGILAPKNLFQRRILEPCGIKMKDYLSKRLLPDEAMLCYGEDSCTIKVLEKKFQETQGSVDEKIQTGVFKLYEYQKFAEPLSKALGKPVRIEFTYILSDWFKQPQYRDVIDFNEQNGIKTFFGNVPLSFFVA